MADPLPEKIGRYEILEVVGQGPLGRVCRARLDGRTVALKVMIAGERASKDVLDRCLDAARQAQAIPHPGILPVLETGIQDGFHLVAMEWVEAGSLAMQLRTGPIEPREAVRIAAQAADALQAAHARGLVHRDLKPANLFPGPRLADFGMALAPEEDERPTPASPGYRSPEQIFSSPDEVDARTDVYSLGAVLYELLTGRPPFDGPDPFTVLKRIELESPRPPGVSTDLDAIVLRALEKDPARRFQSAAEMADALRAPRRGKRRLVLAAVAALTTVAFLATKWVQIHRTEEHLRADSTERLYAFFVRHVLLEGNIRIPYVRSAPAAELEGDGPLVAAIRHSLAGRWAQAESLARESTDPRAEVVRRNALLRLNPNAVEPPLPGWEGAFLAALAGRESADRLPPLARAIVLEHLGRYDQLQEALRSADPDDPLPVCYSLAVKLSYQDDLEKDPGRLSGELLGAAGRGWAGPAPQVFLGVAHLIQGNRSLAEESLARVRASLPAGPDHLSAFLAKHGLRGGADAPPK